MSVKFCPGALITLLQAVSKLRVFWADCFYGLSHQPLQWRKKATDKPPTVEAKPEVVSLCPHVASAFNGTNFSLPTCAETILGRRQVCWCHLAFGQRYHHTDGRVIILLNKNGNGSWSIWLPCWILLLFQEWVCAIGGRVRDKNFSYYTAKMKSFLQLMFISWLMTLTLKWTMRDLRENRPFLLLAP